MAAAEVYVRQLAKRKHGRPVYFPEDMMYPGDVGFFRSSNGSFCRLFNCTVPATHPANEAIGVPNGYKPLTPMRRHIDFEVYDPYLPPQAMTSQSVVRSDIGAQISVPM